MLVLVQTVIETRAVTQTPSPKRSKQQAEFRNFEAKVTQTVFLLHLETLSSNFNQCGFSFCTCLFLADPCGFCLALAFSLQIRVKRKKKLQLQLENENGDRTRWHELETLAVKNLGPATRHKEATVNSTSRELSSQAKAQNVFGIFRSKLILGQKWTVGKQRTKEKEISHRST